MHECAFIGDDSSEELEELMQVAEEKGLLKIKGRLQVKISIKKRIETTKKKKVYYILKVVFY